ncbi:glutamine amidotransferase [Desulfonatronum thioautotrophicum]|uniref:glutamine amidotransferase n=1 Tax=Desulfonatronum thioautotrophicum TaxID=617001 RepID=UPI0005EAF706|nr:glutamine amidotransferase [Desulfonatronum thioautotrophicum]
MCGVAGVVSRGSMSLGNDLLDMLWCVRHRGLDATGIALYEQRDLVRIRVTLPDPELAGELLETVGRFAQATEHRLYQGEGIFTFYDALLDMDPDQIGELHRAIDAHPRLCVHSIGRTLTVYKDQGDAAGIRSRHEIRAASGTHGIGHVRLATESAEDINAAHPFTTPLFPELAIVHNGQFTNYFNLRRFLESKGARFKTRNDSEMAAHYLGWQMGSQGLDLEQAMAAALEDFDGIFTILAATPTQIGYVKDKLAIKPLLVFEQGGVTVFGSEQISLTPLFADVFADEMDPGTVRVWSL